MTENLTLKENLDGNTCRLNLQGWLDSSNAFELEQWLDEKIKMDLEGIIFDCAELQFVSSAGLRVFLTAIRSIGEKENCKLVFSGINESVGSVISATGLDKLMTIQ